MRGRVILVFPLTLGTLIAWKNTITIWFAWILPIRNSFVTRNRFVTRITQPVVASNVIRTTQWMKNVWNVTRFIFFPTEHEKEMLPKIKNVTSARRGVRIVFLFFEVFWTVSTNTFQVQFRHTHLKYSFNTHIPRAVSTHTQFNNIFNTHI